MFCTNCGVRVEENDKFCKKCGEKQNKITTESNITAEDLLMESEYQYDIAIPENEVGVDSSDVFVTQALEAKEDSLLKRFFKGAGIGSLIVGGGFIYISYIILQFLFVAFVGLSMIYSAILLFSSGSIIWGLVVLFIATPIAIGFASFFFIYLLSLAILTLVVWFIIYIFGFNVSYSNVWMDIWLVIKILILGSMVFIGISSLIGAVKSKNTVIFLKTNWFYIPIFIFFVWIFF